MRKDLTGQRFNKLVAIRPTRKNKCRQVYWLCKCDCGNEVEVLGVSLTSGHTKSCGCYNVEAHKIHGKVYSRLYGIYQGMKSRCYNNKHVHYARYGGRGVIICSDWLNSFKSFYDWAINNGYKDNLTIDRINNDGNYEPNNCRWVDVITQGNNRFNNKYITYNNETHTIAEWCRLKNIKYTTFKERLKAGWSIEKALETPVRFKRA